MDSFTHIDQKNLPAMVDIAKKGNTQREAIARGKVFLPATILQNLAKQDFTTKKGSIIQTAIIGGTMGVKKTSELIPFCHPIMIQSCKFEITPTDTHFYIECKVKTIGQTGVEMEAITGVQVAASIIYDMCKSAAKQEITISDIELVKKTGGKNDFER